MPAGYFSAPAALHCPFGRVSQQPLLPNVTLVFCGLEGYDEMKVRAAPSHDSAALQGVAAAAA